MWDMLIGPVVQIFGLIWCEDERKSARWFAVGCLVVVLAAIGFIALIYAG